MAKDYTRISDGPAVITFEDKGNILLLTLLFSLVGLLMLGLGSSMLYNAYQASGSLGLPLILAGTGFAFFSAALLLAFSSTDNPKQIIFDNEKGCIKLQQKENSSRISEAIIPYEDIDGFGIRERTTSSSGSSTSGRTKYYYQIYWQKRDGSRWDLLYYSDRRKSEAYLQWLEENIDLSKSCTIPIKPQLPNRVNLSKMRGHELLQWKNPIDSSYALFGLILTGFATVATGAILKFRHSGDEEWIGWVFLGFCAFIGVLLLYNAYKELTTTYGLLITNHELQFLEIIGGIEKIKHSMPIAEIGSITFDFNEDEGGAMMMVFTKEQLGNTLPPDKTQLTLEKIWTYVRTLAKTPKVMMKGNVIERVHVEYYIQQLLSKHGGGHIL